ncbi:MAG: hypothetical protein KGH63_01610 [Candidatus Micrarchaeota archaeon]|nr:hypothetical protein [Candidatus Micrarchaeota archaeon]
MRSHASQRLPARGRRADDGQLSIVFSARPLLVSRPAWKTDDSPRAQKLREQVGRQARTYFADLLKALSKNAKLREHHDVWCGLAAQFRRCGQWPPKEQTQALLGAIEKVRAKAARIRSPAVRKYGRWQPEKITSRAAKQAAEEAELFLRAIRGLELLQGALDSAGADYYLQMLRQWAGQKEDRGLRFLAHSPSLYRPQ